MYVCMYVRMLLLNTDEFTYANNKTLVYVYIRMYVSTNEYLY